MRSKGAGAKVRPREEKNPDRRIRSRNSACVGLTKAGARDSKDVGLEADIHSKSA